jgi:hypothetical protein
MLPRSPVVSATVDSMIFVRSKQSRPSSSTSALRLPEHMKGLDQACEGMETVRRRAFETDGCTDTSQRCNA